MPSRPRQCSSCRAPVSSQAIVGHARRAETRSCYIRRDREVPCRSRCVGDQSTRDKLAIGRDDRRRSRRTSAAVRPHVVADVGAGHPARPTRYAIHSPSQIVDQDGRSRSIVPSVSCVTPLPSAAATKMACDCTPLAGGEGKRVSHPATTRTDGSSGSPRTVDAVADLDRRCGAIGQARRTSSAAAQSVELDRHESDLGSVWREDRGSRVRDVAADRSSPGSVDARNGDRDRRARRRRACQQTDRADSGRRGREPT